MDENVVVIPNILIDEKFEMAYVGLLLTNPKAISVFYFESKECIFALPWITDIYKLVVFRFGDAYAPGTAKANFTFPKTNEQTNNQIAMCKESAAELGYSIEEAYVKLRKLFLLKRAYINAATKIIQQKVLDIRNYKRYEEMTMKEIEISIEKASYIGGIKQTKLNAGLTEFLIDGNNNLTTGVTMPFPVMTKTFKGLRKGETMSFGMPSNSGKSRFIVNLIAYLTLVQKKKILIISNEMTEDKMKLCLTTTIINNPEIQKLHGQKISKTEAELLALKFRPDSKDNVKLDKEGLIIREENESNEEFSERLRSISSEFVKVTTVTDWIAKEIENAIEFIYVSEHTNQELKNIILDYYYKYGIEYVFYDTLKTDTEHIGNAEELKKTATILSNIAQEFGIFIGSTLQLLENATLPLNLNINDIEGSRTVKEVLDNLCLIKEINNSSYDNYEYALEEDSKNYKSLEMPELLNTKYYACTVDKNRAGSKPRILFRLNLDYNLWEELGYVRFKQK